jgi:hypothetical protein
MRANSLFVVGGLAASLIVVAALTAGPSPNHGHGTDILHWSVRKAMTNEDTNSHASASVDLKQNTQGHANNQRIDLRLRNLVTNTPYQLWALIGDDTNYVHASDFTTDGKGNAKLNYKFVGSSQGHGNGNGKKAGVPDELLPISQLRGLAIGNSATQAVLTANLLAPDKLQYLIKRHLESGDVSADLRLKSTTKKLQFRLEVSGLAATNSYNLALNDAVVASGSSSTNGTLSFTSLPVSAADILTVHTLSLIDAATNTVLSTTLP